MRLEVTMILCEAVRVVEKKLWLLGGGWTRILANAPFPQAIALVAYVPYDMANRRLQLVLKLLDFDGQQIAVKEHEFEVGRPEGTKPGETLARAMAVELNELIYPPGGYVWECSIDGEVVARRPFQAVE
jgi:hypothetical protein